MDERTKKVISKNRKAFQNYVLSHGLEAGLSLQGTEVKALRAGKVQLGEGWVDFENGEAWLRDVHIGLYSHGNLMNHAETRARRLLIKRRQLLQLMKNAETRGYSVVPTEIYFKGPWVKVGIALAKGKKLHDKRETIEKRDSDRAIERALKNSRG